MGTASVAAPVGAARAGAGVGRPGHRDREGDASAEAPALGPDASAMGLDQALADGQAQPAAEPALAVPGGGVLAKQLPEVLPVAFRRHPDGGGVRGVARGVREQVVQHLHDALPVGQHGRQVGRQVDPDGVPDAAADEGAARLVHQGGDLRGLGRDRERARLDAPGIEQVGDQPDHAVGLIVDDAEELARLGRRLDSPLGGGYPERSSPVGLFGWV